MWPCKDGFVSFFFFGGRMGLTSNQELVKWMETEGYADDFISQMDWDKLDWSKVTQDYVDKFQEPVAKFFLTHTKAELLEGAVERGIQIYPLSIAEDMLDSRQLKAREYWTDVEHPELGASITYPGAFIKSSEAPISMRYRAPTIGEHNREIYKMELEFSDKDLVILKQGNVI